MTQYSRENIENYLQGGFQVPIISVVSGDNRHKYRPVTRKMQFNRVKSHWKLLHRDIQHKGASIYDVCNIFECFDPPPPFVRILCNYCLSANLSYFFTPPSVRTRVFLCVPASLRVGLQCPRRAEVCEPGS